MAKRIREEDEENHSTVLPLLSMVDDVVIYTLKPLSYDMHWLFGLLFINRDSLSRFPRYISLLYNEGIHVALDDYGYQNELYYKAILRYLAPYIYSLDLTHYGGSTLNGKVITEFYNVNHLALHDMCLIATENLQKLSRLTSLDLSYHTPSQYQCYMNIEILTNLKTLNLSHNASVCNGGLRQLTNLESLDISHNGIIRVTGIETLTNLKTLNLGGNNSISPYECVTLLTNLQELEITAHRYIDSVDHLAHLRKLIIRTNRPHEAIMYTTHPGLSNTEIILH